MVTCSPPVSSYKVQTHAGDRAYKVICDKPQRVIVLRPNPPYTHPVSVGDVGQVRGISLIPGMYDLYIRIVVEVVPGLHYP